MIPTIRPVEEADLSACAEIFAAVFAVPPYTDRWDPGDAESKLRKLRSIDPDCCLCADEAGQVLGALFARRDRWWIGDCLIVEELFVEMRHQDRGVGTALMEAIEAKARAEGAVGLWLTSNNRAPALRFYERRGFAGSSEVTVLIKMLRQG